MAAAGAVQIRSRSRPRELEDPLNHFVYHPLAARLARLLVPTPVTPNMVSLLSLVMLLAATWAFTSLAAPGNALAGLGFMLLWHVVDGADGDLARMTGRASATGELIDGMCDYAGNIVLYVAFAAWLDDSIGPWAWALAVAAGASHIVQTNHAETQRRLYLWRAYGVPWLRTAAASGDDLFRGKGWFGRWCAFWAKAYVWLSNHLSPSANPIDTALAAAAGKPAQTERIRAFVRGHSRASLILEKALGANPKTLIIAASIALGGPLYFFVAMVTALNLVLLVSILHHKRMERALVAAISAAS